MMINRGGMRIVYNVCEGDGHSCSGLPGIVLKKMFEITSHRYTPDEVG